MTDGPIIVQVEHNTGFVSGCLTIMLVLFILAGLSVFGFFVVLGKACGSATPAPGHSQPNVTAKGARIIKVHPNSYAAKLGLVPGDYLLEWNSVPVTSQSEFDAAREKTKFSQTDSIVYIHAGKQIWRDLVDDPLGVELEP